MTIFKNDRRKLSPEGRKARAAAILNAAVAEAEAVGYNKITREGVARRAGVSTGSVSLYAKTMAQLRRQVMRHAVKHGVLPIIGQGLAIRDPHALKAPEPVKRAALDHLLRNL